MTTKSKSPLGANQRAGGGTDKNQNQQHPDYSRNSASPQHSSKIGALLKLDHCEQRLQAAQAAGDDLAWVRWYLAWLRLHAVAFGWKAGQR